MLPVSVYLFLMCVLVLHLTAPKPALNEGNMRGVGGHSEPLFANMTDFEKNRSFSSCSLLVLIKHVCSLLLRIKMAGESAWGLT